MLEKVSRETFGLASFWELWMLNGGAVSTVSSLSSRDNYVEAGIQWESYQIFQAIEETGLSYDDEKK